MEGMNIFGFNPTLFWFVLGFVFLVLEVLTPGTFLLFFGLGAWVVSALTFFLPASPAAPWQCLIFVAASVAALAVFRQRLKSFFERRLPGAGNLPDTVFTSQYLDKEVEVIEAVSPEKPGRVELNGTLWQALSETETFPAGRRVRVFKMSGLTLWVRPRV